MNERADHRPGKQLITHEANNPGYSLPSGNVNDRIHSNTPPVELRQIGTGDLPAVAKVHVDSFPQSALTKLGHDIVERYYLWQLTGPHKKVRAVGAFVDDDCVGFSFSGVFKGSLSGFVNNNRPALFKKVIFRPWLLLDEMFIERLMSGVKVLSILNRTPAKQLPTFEDRPASYGILSIAVKGSCQGLGIGKLLMLDAEREAVECGFTCMHLTVNPDNKKSVAFYERLGWERRVVGDRWKGSMVKTPRMGVNAAAVM